MGRNIKDDIFGGGYKQPINQKAKGNRNELVVCKVLEEWVGEPFARVPSSGGLRWKDFNNAVGDVVCQNSKVIFPFVIETKHLKSYAVDKTLRSNSKFFTIYERQAKPDAIRAKKLPMLLIRKNGMPEGEYNLVIESEISDYLDLHDYEFSGCTTGEDGELIRLRGWSSKKFFKKYPYAWVLAEFQELVKDKRINIEL